MLRRLATIAVACAVTVPMFGGTASASCLDDLQAHPIYGNARFDASDHWLNWAHVEGTATVIVEGDALIHDTSWLTVYFPAFTQGTATNVVGATTGFVDCVAG